LEPNAVPLSIKELSVEDNQVGQSRARIYLLRASASGIHESQKRTLRSFESEEIGGICLTRENLWVRIASSVRGFVISDIDQMSEITNPRTLEAMRTQGAIFIHSGRRNAT
jgi:hypothetical protein